MARTVIAMSRHDMSALIEVRKGLEQGHDVTVAFQVYEAGKPDFVVFTPRDLKAVIWKITCSM